MATNINPDDMSYVRNNTGKMNLAYKGYLFKQKTNLVKVGKTMSIPL